MADVTPTPQDARASLDEAAKQAAGLRRADSAFRPILLALATTYLGVAVLLSINPRGGNILIGDGVLITYVVGVAITFYLAWRIRAWSRVGTVWLVVSTLGFMLWNLAVIWASICFASTDSLPGTHPAKSSRSLSSASFRVTTS